MDSISSKKILETTMLFGEYKGVTEAKIAELEAENAELKAENARLKELIGLHREQKMSELGLALNHTKGIVLKHIDALEAENSRLREAILTWYNGSPEDAASDEQLCQEAVALLLQEQENE